MMPRVVIFLLVLSASSLNLLVAQKFEPGYILTNRGDSLAGLVSYNFKRGDQSVLFKKEKSYPAMMFNTRDCRRVGYLNKDLVYESWPLKIDMSYLDPGFRIMNEDSVRFDTVFLKSLYLGKKISLYTSRDVKEHFYVYVDGEMEELIMKYTRPMDNPAMNVGRAPNHKATRVFRDQLTRYFDWMNETRLKRTIDFAEYRQGELLEIVQWIDMGQHPRKSKRRTTLR